jgi:hypothetical protein
MSRLRLLSRDPALGAVVAVRYLAVELPIGEPVSMVLFISAAPRSTKATAQNQNNSTMTPPSAPNDLW